MFDAEVVQFIRGVPGRIRSTAARPFWRRQFAREGTLDQGYFDSFFGVVAPALCLAFDPIVFRGSRTGSSLLFFYDVGGLLTIGLSIVVLIARVFVRPSAWLSGMLAGAAIFAFLLGLFLFPFSVVGLFVAIGVFGFTPLVTSWVFARNAVRVSKEFAYPSRPIGRLASAAAFMAGLFVVLGAPAGAQWYVSSEIASGTWALTSDDPHEREAGVERIARIQRIVRSHSTTDPIIWRWSRETDEVRRDRLAGAYRQLTGGESEHRWRAMSD
jgi:hypothetical protein